MCIKPKISIILTIHENIKYNKECIKSLANQTIDIEVFVIITKDISQNIISLYKKEKFVEFIEEKQLSSVINKIQGEYVLFLNSSDWLLMYGLQKAYALCKKSKLDVLINSYFSFDEKDKNIYYPNHGLFDHVNHTENKKELMSTILELPKNNFNIYNVKFIKENNLELPFKMLDNTLFFIKACYLSNNIKYTYDTSINKRINTKNNIISSYEIISDDYLLKNSLRGGFKYESEDVLENFNKILNFMVETNLIYDKQILKYVFNLYRRCYFSKIVDNDTYFVGLKKIYENIDSSLSKYMNSNLTQDNLIFYKNVLKVNTNNELELLLKIHSLISQKKNIEKKYSNLKIEKEHISSDSIYQDKHYLKKFLRGRVDIKNIGNYSNSIKILEVSDKKANISNPPWFKDKNGEGIIIESEKKYLNISFKCINDGQIELTLRGIDFRDYNRKRIPIFIDFQKLMINDKVIFDSSTLVSHDTPYSYKFDVKNNEEFSIKLNWLPLNNKSIL